MKHLRLVALVLAAFVGGAAFAHAGACAKSASASSCCANGKSVSAASASAHASGCPASANCPMGSAQCTAKGASASAAAASCCGNGKSANAGECSMHGAKGASAAEAMNCGACGFALSVASNGGGKCDGSMADTHMGCAVCSDGASCSDELRGVNAHTQVVALRNGAMIVYTADNAEGVRMLQSTLRRHNEHVMNALASTSEASLCSGCRVFRGAMASGKFTRELVNVKNGAQILVTSNDKDIVRRIHGLTGAQSAQRAKM